MDPELWRHTNKSVSSFSTIEARDVKESTGIGLQLVKEEKV
jgi:hypothetical protein